MVKNADDEDVPPVKDPEREHPIPTAWRATLSAVVDRLVVGDFELLHPIPGVASVHADTAKQMREYVQDYDAVTLVELTDNTWSTSVASWQSDHWETLIDLRTMEEGRSDLVLHVLVRENGPDYRFEIYMICVP